MSKYIYEVCLSRGRSHPEHHQFYINMNNLSAKAPDYGGINNMCILAHHSDAKTVHLLCSDSIKAKGDVTVEEITRETLDDEQSPHRVHKDIVNKYFLPYGKYPNIE